MAPLSGFVKYDHGNPPSSSLGQAGIPSPKLVAAGVDGRGQVQGVGGLETVLGTQIRGEIEHGGSIATWPLSGRPKKLS